MAGSCSLELHFRTSRPNERFSSLNIVKSEIHPTDRHFERVGEQSEGTTTEKSYTKGLINKNKISHPQIRSYGTLWVPTQRSGASLRNDDGEDEISEFGSAATQLPEIE